MIKPPGEQAKTMRTTVELHHIDSRWSDGVLQMGGAILYTWIAEKIEIPRHQNEQIWFFSTKNSTLSFKQAFSWTWIHLRTTKQKRSAKEFLAFLTLCTHTPLSGYDPHCHRWWLYSTAYVKNFPQLQSPQKSSLNSSPPSPWLGHLNASMDHMPKITTLLTPGDWNSSEGRQHYWKAGSFLHLAHIYINTEV